MLPSEPAERLAALAAGGSLVLHFYDLTCPFCYLAQNRTEVLADRFPVAELPFQPHPDIPPAGMMVGQRSGPTYDLIARTARDQGLPLRWQAKLPNSRAALSAAEWVRQHQNSQSDAFRASLFHAHFAGGQDIGDPAVILRLAGEHQVDTVRLAAALADGTAENAVADAGAVARRLGVAGTPAWSSRGRLVTGLVPMAELLDLLPDNAAVTPDQEP